MAGGDRRKCKCCLELFRPDPRNRRHQRYCCAPRCRAASKAASQARWVAKPENQDYFRGPVHVARVRRWRSSNPGYWRRAEPPAVRYKMSQWRKSLILLTKQPISCAHRYKTSYRPNLLF
jgi:hypothetical protein